MKHFYTLKV